MSDHGALFDTFRGQATHDHDGSYYDSFRQGSAGSGDSHGTLFDQGFRDSSRVGSHGERWDQFDWKAMPVLHGDRFDETFSEPSAFSGTHGSWFDAFRGGAATRFITSAPVPVDHRIGTRPAKAAATVMNFGRMRFTAP